MTLEQESQNNIMDGDDNVWLHSLPDDLKLCESLKKFKDIPSLANSYLELEKSLNNRVAIPKSDAPPEEWNKFYDRLERPENKRYTDNRTAEDEPYLSSYEEMFYNSGLSKRQGEKLLERLYNFSSDLQKKQEEEIQSFRNSNIEWLKNHYKYNGLKKLNKEIVRIAW